MFTDSSITSTSTATANRVAKGGVLILGGGFAGAYVAQGLGRSGATIVNPSNYMLYTPLLPEAAAGSVEPRHVTVPLRAMCPHAELLLGSVVAVDRERRVATVESEAGRFSVAYAELVVALGSVTRMPDVPGLREHAFPLKDLADAIRVRNRILRQIELADADPARARGRLTFVVAGAGYAGVETIAELHEMASDALRRHPRLRDMEPRWLLVDGASRILGQTPPGLAAFAQRTLSGRGIEVLTETFVSAVGPRGVMLSDGRWVGSETVVWTAGVSANPMAAALGLPCDAAGRVEVDETLRVAGARHIWALGDCAAVPNEAAGGDLDPPTCQHALRQARRLARNLRGTPEPYRYRTRGQMATLGRRHGIAVVFGMRVRGLPGWLIARGYHLLQLPFASRRARVLFDWTAAALFKRDVAELSVTPEPRAPHAA